MLTTSLTDKLGIEHPIIQAGMGSDCGTTLAAAVSNAGGLGTIGSIGRSPEELEQELARMKEQTARPWAVNIVSFDWAPFAATLLDVAIAARPPAVTLSFGDTVPSIEKCRAAGLWTAVQVQDFASARAVLAAHPDVLIVQGNEAGGHTGHRGTLSFAAQVIDIAGDVPVVVAGGVANGRGLAAVLAMGGAGVVMGTRFKATAEFGGPGSAHIDAQRAAIVQNDGDRTVWDEIADLALGIEWPGGVLGRVLANRFTDAWLGRGDSLRDEVSKQEHPFAWTSTHNSEPETVLNWAGESSGLIHEVLPAAEVVQRTVAEAEQLLRNVARVVR
ncbi:MAG: nitronate monooxygenase [Dehalococcoidia bacterium]|nr:nitronate monooxygenase [Dehalococcoidia bacterium]